MALEMLVYICVTRRLGGIWGGGHSEKTKGEETETQGWRVGATKDSSYLRGAFRFCTSCRVFFLKVPNREEKPLRD